MSAIDNQELSLTIFQVQFNGFQLSCPSTKMNKNKREQ